MSPLIALLLGCVQGLTEFFPVSSSTHLKLVKMFCCTGHVPVIFDLACHLGSLGALIWFFRSDIHNILFKNQRKVLVFFVALLPLIPGYFILGPLRVVAAKTELIGLFLMATSGILFAGQKIRFKFKENQWRDPLLIGAMQSAALIPGISRSASTIACAQMLGWTPKEAVRFSFLLAIPTIIGGNLLELKKLASHKELSTILNPECFIAFMSAFIVGTFVIRFAINWLEKGNFNPFAWYCLLLGSATSLYLFLK